MLLTNKIIGRMLSIAEFSVLLIYKLSWFTGGMKGLEKTRTTQKFLKLNWECLLSRPWFELFQSSTWPWMFSSTAGCLWRNLLEEVKWQVTKVCLGSKCYMMMLAFRLVRDRWTYLELAFFLVVTPALFGFFFNPFFFFSCYMLYR